MDVQQTNSIIIATIEQHPCNSLMKRLATISRNCSFCFYHIVRNSNQRNWYSVSTDNSILIIYVLETSMKMMSKNHTPLWWCAYVQSMQNMQNTHTARTVNYITMCNVCWHLHHHQLHPIKSEKYHWARKCEYATMCDCVCECLCECAVRAYIKEPFI